MRQLEWSLADGNDLRRFQLFPRNQRFLCLVQSLAMLCLWFCLPANAQPPTADALDFRIAMPELSLPLEVQEQTAFKDAMKARNFTAAETILVEAATKEIARDKQSKKAAQLYAAVGGVFFLNGEFLNAAISFKKAEAITPLDARNRFTLAMSYIRLNRRDWAKPELERLVKEQPANALYLYWLARLDYDAQQYNEAIAKLTKVIALDPMMMRAYDNLGLCHDYLGQYAEAVKHYRKAIELNRQQPRASAWPHVNLAITLLAQNQLTEAESQLREAIRLEPRLPQAHYQLGLALEKLNRANDAIKALEEAARLEAKYAEPHYALGRLYQKQGDKAKAQAAMAKFQELKPVKK